MIPSRQQVSPIILKKLLCRLSLIQPCRFCEMESLCPSLGLLEEFNKDARFLSTFLFCSWNDLAILFIHPFLLENGIPYILSSEADCLVLILH